MRHRLLVRGKRISAITAMCWGQGIFDVKVTSSSVDGEKFCDFIRGSHVAIGYVPPL